LRHCSDRSDTRNGRERRGKTVTVCRREANDMARESSGVANLEPHATFTSRSELVPLRASVFLATPHHVTYISLVLNVTSEAILFVPLPRISNYSSDTTTSLPFSWFQGQNAPIPGCAAPETSAPTAIVSRNRTTGGVQSQHDSPPTTRCSSR
jgi:hypothetical protein